MTSWIGLLLAVVSGIGGFVLAQDRRITRLEERLVSLGQQLRDLPKRKTDRVND